MHTNCQLIVNKFGINSDKFVLMNEIGEVAAAILDTRVVSVINKFEPCIDYIHISDQYSGPKNAEWVLFESTNCHSINNSFNYRDAYQTVLKLPEVKKVMIFSFNRKLNYFQWWLLTNCCHPQLFHLKITLNHPLMYQQVTKWTTRMMEWSMSGVN